MSERVQERIRVCEAEVREILYGEAGCPVLGARFTTIEAVAMSVGEELSRRFMASADSPSLGPERQPETALSHIDGPPAGVLD